MLKQVFFLLLIVSAFYACDNNDKIVNEAEKSKVNLKVIHLEDSLFNLKNAAEAGMFLKNHPDLVQTYLKLPYPVKDSTFINAFYQHYSNDSLKLFYENSSKEFGNFSEVNNQFEDLFKYITYYYPKYNTPTLKTLFSGFVFGNDLALSDSSIFISFEYFLGPKSTYKPPLFEYFLERYQKPYLVPMVALALSGRFNNADMKDESMIASMVYYGKAHYFVERTMPRLPDSLNIMYSAETLKGIEENIDIIWSHFIEKELLYNKVRFINDKYCGERPSIPEIGDKCPGRIGRWLGWQIVKSYMAENPEITLQQLMEDPNAEKIFRKSNYKPRK